MDEPNHSRGRLRRQTAPTPQASRVSVGRRSASSDRGSSPALEAVLEPAPAPAADGLATQTSDGQRRSYSYTLKRDSNGTRHLHFHIYTRGGAAVNVQLGLRGEDMHGDGRGHERDPGGEAEQLQQLVMRLASRLALMEAVLAVVAVCLAVVTMRLWKISGGMEQNGQ